MNYEVKRFYIGMVTDGVIVCISKESPNQMVAISGLSGSGKTRRVLDMELKAVETGRTVVVIDRDGTHPNIGGERVNYIDASKDGLNIEFLDENLAQKSNEDYVNFVTYTTGMFASAYILGDRQQGAIREAIEFASKHRLEFANDMEAIGKVLQAEGTSHAKSAYEKMWPLLQCGVFRKSKKVIQKGKINIISLAGLDTSLQKKIAEVFLGALWREIRINRFTQTPLTIVLDEFQNLSLKKDGTLMEMLRESRKYGVNLLLSTQTFAGFSKEVMAALNQSATRLYFRPAVSDMKKAAEEIDPQNVEHWMLILQRLKKGQSVAIGNFEVKGKIISKPLVIKTDYEETISTALV